MSRRPLGLPLGGALFIALVGAYACGGDDDGSGGGGASPDGAGGLADGAGLEDGASPDGSADGGRADGSTFDGGPCSLAVSVTSLEPPFAGPGASTVVTIEGANFESTPTVVLRSSTGAIVPLGDVSILSVVKLTARVSGAPSPPVGTYDVVVTNPNGCFGNASGFKVVSTKVPQVSRVLPEIATTAADTNVSVRGCNFPATANASLVTMSATGASTTHVTTSVTCTGPGCPDGSAECTLNGVVKAPSLAPGGHVVRVVDKASGAYGEYGPFGVATSDGSFSGGWLPAPPLRVARRAHAAITGRITDTSRFVYAVGGEGGAGTPLASVEMTPVTRFGDLAGFIEMKTPLATPRSGIALARAGSHLFAIGGTTSTQGTFGVAPSGARSAVVERARILDPAVAPQITNVQITPNVGVFPAGTFYYRVSARGLPDGESLPGAEAVVILSANDSVSLTWSAVPGATGYTVYRSPTPFDLSGTGRRIVTLIAGTSFNNPGNTVFIKTERAIPVGSTGTWLPESSLITPRLHASAVVLANPLGALFLYVLGGWGVCPGSGAPSAMDCYEYAPVNAATGALGAFTTGTERMQRPRMRFGAEGLTPANTPALTLGTSVVLAVGGAGQSASNATAEFAAVTIGGQLSAFAPAEGFGQERDGTALAVGNGYAYAIGGGSGGTYDSTIRRSSSMTAAPGLSLGVWAPLTPSLPTPAGNHAVVTDSAFFYVFGGTADDVIALDNSYRVIY